VDEGDAPAVGADTGSFVDEADTVGGETLEFALNVVDAVSDVVHTVTSLIEKAGDCSFRVGWRNDLDYTRTSVKGHKNDTLLGHRHSLRISESERLVMASCGIEISDHDSEVVQSIAVAT
jgi:hypothetical protein